MSSVAVSSDQVSKFMLNVYHMYIYIYIYTNILTDIPHKTQEVRLLQFLICNGKTARFSGQMVQRPRFLSTIVISVIP